MTDRKDIIRMAREALEDLRVWGLKQSMTITALRGRLAQPEQSAPSMSGLLEDWRGMSRLDALRAIERHAVFMSDVDNMMSAWLAANQSAPLQLELCGAGKLYRIDFIRAYRAAHGIKGES